MIDSYYENYIMIKGEMTNYKHYAGWFGYNSYSLFAKIDVSDIQGYIVRGLPLIMYASRGVGGSTLMHTNAYKGGGAVCIFVRRFIENAAISE